ncbi:5-oxoprolinase subunit C family protein [Paenibacillus cymbidii]|uniref:5-oxoprolinase subunit C family protein n=1 Tax=Paenibacillus cymbidii TaxID=1639034 RepID=UPI0010815381|nr:biotin-dependent carboxyltransferase family protein [Paenibacillus cymbidii]
MIAVIEPGLRSALQDAGRFGYRRIGVPASGAADAAALRAANLLVGNAPGAACIETTLRGPTLRFAEDALVALTGAPLAARIDSDGPLPHAAPFFVRAGATLTLGGAARGLRGCVAVAGGFAAPAPLGSRSVYAPAGLGRPLAAGDVLSLGAPSASAQRLLRRLREGAGDAAWAAAGWRAAADLAGPAGSAAGGAPVRVRVVPGRELVLFAPASREALFAGAYAVTPQADRMGCRLRGEPLLLAQPLELVSEAVAPGTVQVPPDGQPIVLLADCQTTGGYPRIAHVAAVDLPLVAQAPPGSRLAFEPIGMEEADRLHARRERDFALLAAALEARMRQ